jgi:hypothetical protein
MASKKCWANNNPPKKRHHMKKYITLFACALSIYASAQEFDKNLATAKSSYSAGKLEDARFAMEQMLRDLDAAIGKEILKMMPTKMGAMNANVANDNVTGGAGIAAGLFVQRNYGTGAKTANVEIINNSPLIAGLNTMLSLPMLGNSDPNQKQVKVQGYKSLLRKEVDSETGKTNYELQTPFNNTLLTLRVNDSNEAEILGFANTIPLAKIAEFAQ